MSSKYLYPNKNIPEKNCPTIKLIEDMVERIFDGISWCILVIVEILKTPKIAIAKHIKSHRLGGFLFFI